MEHNRILGMFLVCLIIFIASAQALTVTVDSQKHDLINHEIVFVVNTMGDTGNISKAWDFNLSNLESRQIVNPHYYLKEIVTKQRTVSVTNPVNCDPQKIATYTDSNGLWAYCWNKNNPKPTDARLYACQNATGTICFENVVTTETQNYDVEEWVEQVQPSKKKEGNKWILGIPAKEFKKNEIKYIKLTYDIPISTSQWGSTGNWAMNPSGWWDNNWLYKQAITLKTSDMNLVADVNGKIHALALNINSSNTDFWANVRSDFNDLRFIKDDNTAITFFIEDSNYAGKSIWLWLKIDNNFLKNTNVSIGSMYYGNANSVNNASNETATYPSTYLRAFNFTNELYNSTGSGNNLTDGGGTTQIDNWGIGKAVAINGSSGLSGYTATFPTTGFSNGYSLLMLMSSHSPSGTNPYEVVFRQVGSGTYAYNAEINLYNSTFGSTGLTNTEINVGTVNADTKYSIALTTYLGAGSSYFYSNGLQIGTRPYAHDTTLTSATYIGRHSSANNFGLDGNLDALRLLNYQLSADEVKLINQVDTNNASVFNFGVQQSQPPGPIPIDMNLQVLDIFDNLQLINSMDCNSSLVTYSNQQSPYIKSFTDTNKYYSCTFTSTGYDSNTVMIYTDTNNKLTTVYLTDSTPPVVGNITIKDFNVYAGDRNYIKGTGYFTSTFTHPGHPVNTCAFTRDNNAVWVAGTVTDNNLCTSPSFTITDDVNYNVRIRVTDESLNSGYSNTQNYFGDVEQPLQYGSITQYPNQTKSNIVLTCNDQNKSGCKNIYYTVDSNATVTTYTTDFNVSGAGQHTIQFWATDNLDNNSYPGTISQFNIYGYLTVNIYDENASFITSTIIDDGNKYINGQPYAQPDYWTTNSIKYTLPANTQNYPTTIYARGYTGLYQAGWVIRFRFYDSQNNMVSTQILSSYCTQPSETCYAEQQVSISDDIKSYDASWGCLGGVINLPTTPGSYCGLSSYPNIDSLGIKYLTNIDISSPINSSSIFFNNLVYTNTLNNTYSIPLQGLTSGTYTLDINSTGYSTCQQQYTTNLTQYTDQTVNFGLIKDANCNQVPLTVFQPDGSTKFNTASILLIKATNNLVLGKKLTDTSGSVTFGFNKYDQNYRYSINDGNYYYTPVALTVSYPKDERTLTQIIYPWYISITQNLYALYENLVSDTIIYLLPNTTLPYNLEIGDMNEQYFSRNYSAYYPGNPGSATLQPYLISDLNANVLTITTKSSYTQQNLKDVIIKVYGYIPAVGLTYVEQVITGTDGEATITVLPTRTYEFQIFYKNNYLRTDRISGNKATLTIYIPDLDYTTPTYGTANISIKYTPTIGQLLAQDRNLGQIITVNDFNANETINGIFIEVWNTSLNGNDSNNVLLKTVYYSYTTNQQNTTITNFFTLDGINATIDGLTYDYTGNLKIKVIVNTNDGNWSSYQLYKPYTGLNLVDNLGWSARTTFGCVSYYDEYGNPNPLVPCPTMLFVAIMISLLATIGIAISSGFNSLRSVAVIFLLGMGVFTYLTWVPAGLYTIMMAASIGFYLVRGWIR